MSRSQLSMRRAVAVLSLPVALVFIARSIELEVLRATLSRLWADPWGLSLALAAYFAAFAVRAVVWSAVLPGLKRGYAFAALHTSLAANHLLPLRLGEAVRVTDVVRRAGQPLAAASASTLLLRTADIVAVLLLAAVFAPAAVLATLLGGWLWPVTGFGVVLIVVAALWLRRLLPPVRGGRVSLALLGALAAWLLESAMLLRAAHWAGFSLSLREAVVVTAITIAAQVFAVAPGGFGTYEAAATAAMVALGAPAAPAFAAALAAHAVKTAYALVGGAIAVFIPTPGLLGAWRLPRAAGARALAPAPPGPVVLFMPAYNEEAAVAEVVQRVPAQVCGREVITLVIDDGSADETVTRAAQAGAEVISHEHNLGLGAAVRTGLAEAVRLRAAAVAFCDADGEYAPEELALLVQPILDGQAHYVAGSRFAGEIRHMRPHRRFGNIVLTRVLRWVARVPISDGQTGYRAFSAQAAAEAELVHDYNYAQVLTLDLIAKGFGYHEVPIGYAFRETGTSFVRLGRYLRHVVPAVYRELNPAR